MALPTQLPDALATLVARLEEWNFVVASDDQGDGFGDRMITLRMPPIAVRVVADRDQWFVELSQDEWDDWFDPDVWRACLNNSPIPDEPRLLIDQASFVVNELERITRAARGQGGRLLPCLRETRAARSRRRLGLDE